MALSERLAAVGDGTTAGRYHELAERIGVSPARITAVYLALGLAALVFSDAYLPTVYSGTALREAQAIKGAAEVLFTAGLIYGLTATGHAALRRTAAEAERNRTELQLLHRVLRHNLRNNLTLVLGNAKRLRADLEDPSDCARCDEVITAAEEIETWTRQAGQIRRVTADADPIELDAVEALPALVADSDCLDGERIAWRLPAAAPVRVSPQFELVIEELLSNALEHGTEEATDGQPVEVAVSCQGHRTTITIVDDGPGFPQHVLDAVNRGGEDQLVHLDGLGLWLVYLVVANCEGELLLENTADGASARVTVPTARY